MATVLAVLVGVVNRRGYAWALAIGGVTPVGAALASGDVALPTFYAVSIGAAIGLVARWLFRKGGAASTTPTPGGTALVLLMLVTLVVTLGAPIVFNNTYVLSPGAPSRLTAGVVTKSNIAQLLYLFLGICVVFFLAHSRWAGVEIIGFTVCATTALSLWSYLNTVAGVPYPTGVFDNSPAFTFQETLPGGGLRVRGILSEPAGLAVSSLSTIAYALARLNAVGGVKRIALLASIAAAVYLGSISTSATFFVAGVALAVVALCVVGGSVLFARRKLGTGAIAAVCAAAVAAIWLLPLLSSLLAGVIGDKVVSSSYTERSGSDSYAYDLARATLGVGVGVGANRASSFLPGMLSTIGVTGTLLFFLAVAAVLRASWRHVEVRPAAWVLFAVLVSKFISGPDLADTSGLTWTTLGVLAAAGVRGPGPGLTSWANPRAGRSAPSDGAAAHPPHLHTKRARSRVVAIHPTGPEQQDLAPVDDRRTT